MSVTIICPNARRVQVKTSPMMLLRQVLEEACLKSGFDVNCYQLQTQSRKPIDLSLPFRLSGLSNNSTLEMTVKETSVEGTVVDLALQGADGKRHQKQVSASSTLFDILKIFSQLFAEDLASNLDSKVPCIIYMNKRYTGIAELSENTLVTLGVTSGKCLIRYMRVQLSEEEISRINAKQQAEVERKKANLANFEKLKAENKERERIETLRQEAFEKEKDEREKREIERLKALIPENEAQPMDTSNFHAPVQRDILQEVPQQNPNNWSFDGPAFSRPVQNTMRLEELNRLLERVDSSLNPNASVPENQMDAMVEALADGGRISLAEMRARAESEIREKQMEHDEAPEVFDGPCDRQAVIYNKASKSKIQCTEEPMEVGEEFFEVGINDVKAMQRDLRKTVREQTQGAFVSRTFLAKKNRHLKLEAYNHTVLRITIGEHILQACFKTGEPSTRLDEFVRSWLIDENAKRNVGFFFLKQRISTDNQKNFIDLELAPKSNLVARFGSDFVDAKKILNNVREVDFDEAERISNQWLSVNRQYVPYNSLVNEERAQKRQPTVHTGMDFNTSPSSREPPAKSALPRWMNVKKH